MVASGLKIRACPLCGGTRSAVIFDLEAADFCRVNWTYVDDFRRVLELPDMARFPIHRCEACAFLFAGLLPSQEFLTRVYEEVIKASDCRAGSENQESYTFRLRYLAVLLEVAAAHGKPARTALDFGAGLGVTLRLLGACGVAAWGLDPSPSRAAYAAAGGAKVVSSLEALALKAPFDLLICDNVLEHLPDPVAAIKELSGLIAEDGVAFVSVPDYGGVKVRAQLAALAEGSPIDMTLNPWEHLNYFDLPHLDQLLLAGGFRRLRSSRLSAPVPIGLRPEPRMSRRTKNSLASFRRLVKYAWSGRGVETTEFAFYRKVQ